MGSGRSLVGGVQGTSRLFSGLLGLYVALRCGFGTQLRVWRRLLHEFYNFTINMQSKWPSRTKSTVKYIVFEGQKIQKCRPEVLRMQVKRWFCMFGLLCRRSLKKLQNLVQNDLQKPENRPQDASKTALPKNGNRPWRCSTPILPPGSTKPPQNFQNAPQEAPKTSPRSPQEPQRPPNERGITYTYWSTQVLCTLPLLVYHRNAVL